MFEKVFCILLFYIKQQSISFLQIEGSPLPAACNNKKIREIYNELHAAIYMLLAACK